MALIAIAIGAGGGVGGGGVEEGEEPPLPLHDESIAANVATATTRAGNNIETSLHRNGNVLAPNSREAPIMPDDALPLVTT